MGRKGESNVPNGPAIETPRRSLSRHLAGLAALLLAALAVGIAVAGSSPEWPGTEPENLSNSPNDSAEQPHIASSASEQMVVVWSDERTAGERYIYTSLSEDSGRTWSSPQVVSETAYVSRLPHTAFVGERIFVTWVTGDITQTLYEKELTTTHQVRIVPSPVKLVQTRPRLAGDSQRLHMIFHAGSNEPDIYYTSRPLTDTSWPTATIIHTHTAVGAWNPSLAIGSDEKTLHAVWEERDLGGEAEIVYMSGTMDTSTVGWSPPITLSAGITLSRLPDVAVDSAGNVHVVWEEIESNERYVRYRAYDAASASWQPLDNIEDSPIRTNKKSPYYTYSSLALFEEDGSTKVCVVWNGIYDENALAEEIFISCSENGGEWSPPSNISRTAGDTEVSSAPQIVFDDQGWAHVVWNERTGSSGAYDYEIYYARELDRRIFLPLVLRS